MCSCFVRPRQVSFEYGWRLLKTQYWLPLLLDARRLYLNRSTSPSALVYFRFGRVARFVVASRPVSALEYYGC